MSRQGNHGLMIRRDDVSLIVRTWQVAEWHTIKQTVNQGLCTTMLNKTCTDAEYQNHVLYVCTYHLVMQYASQCSPVDRIKKGQFGPSFSNRYSIHMYVLTILTICPDVFVAFQPRRKLCISYQSMFVTAPFVNGLARYLGSVSRSSRPPD